MADFQVIEAGWLQQYPLSSYLNIGNDYTETDYHIPEDHPFCDGEPQKQLGQQLLDKLAAYYFATGNWNDFIVTGWHRATRADRERYYARIFVNGKEWLKAAYAMEGHQHNPAGPKEIAEHMAMRNRGEV